MSFQERMNKSTTQKECYQLSANEFHSILYLRIRDDDDQISSKEKNH